LCPSCLQKLLLPTTCASLQANGCNTVISAAHQLFPACSCVSSDFCIIIVRLHTLGTSCSKKKAARVALGSILREALTMANKIDAKESMFRKAMMEGTEIRRAWRAEEINKRARGWGDLNQDAVRHLKLFQNNAQPRKVTSPKVTTMRSTIIAQEI